MSELEKRPPNDADERPDNNVVSGRVPMNGAEGHSEIGGRSGAEPDGIVPLNGGQPAQGPQSTETTTSIRQGPTQPEYGQYAPTMQHPTFNQPQNSSSSEGFMRQRENGYANPNQTAPYQMPQYQAQQFSHFPGQKPVRKPARTITLKVWQFVLSMIGSAVMGFFVILFVVGAIMNVGGATGGNTTQAGSQSTQSGQSESETKPEKKEKVLLESISADYSGSTEAGTEINESTSGITVTGSYSDGSVKPITGGYTIKNPGTLEAGKTQEFTVVYEGHEASFSVTVKENDEQFKASAQDIPFDELARNPQANNGKRVHFRGKVVQVIEDDSVPQYRVSVQQGDYGIWDSDKVVYVLYPKTESDNRILEDDIVEIWGTSTGTITYKSTLGGDITIPSISARIMQISQ